MKRLDYISWKDYFMNLAILSSYRSKDPSQQVGAAAASSDNKVLGLGYNGFPINCSDDEFPWGKIDKNPLNNKYLYVVHAECNLIVSNNSKELKGSSLYTTLYPCCECAKLIIQSGIKEVYYLDDKYHDTDSCIAARRMFDASGIEYFQYTPTKKIKLE